MGGEGGDGMLSLTKSPKAWGCADLPEQACGLAGIKRRTPNCFWQFPARLSFKKKLWMLFRNKWNESPNQKSRLGEGRWEESKEGEALLL